MVSNVGLNFLVKRGGRIVESLMCQPHPKMPINFQGIKYTPALKKDTTQFNSLNRLSKYVKNFKQKINKETNEVVGSYTYKDKKGVEHSVEYKIYNFIGKKSDRRLTINIDGEYAGYADIGAKNCDNFSHKLCRGCPNDSKLLEVIKNWELSIEEEPAIMRKNSYFANGGIYIDYMESYKPGAGTQIHKIIAQRSLDLGYSGRIGLDADFNAHCFHYKCGFRPYNSMELGHIDQKKSVRLANLLEEAEKVGKRVESPMEIRGGRYTMMLPEENLEKLFAM
ncbi:hypothetical protein J6P92_05250 [bacterium]|nr:hypothetical protein [bacterium]